MPDAEDLQAQADQLLWYHTIDLGHGVQTKGLSAQSTGAEILPDVKGKTVLDIGAWDGRFSFLAEQAGAAAVTALDHYAWGVDFVARGGYWNECIANGTFPDQARDETDFWRPELPGRRGFEFAKQALDSKVEPVVANFATTDLDALGRFDVVLYLGVLYHMKEPLTCLERVRQVTKGVAVIETEAVHFERLGHAALLQFYAGGNLQTDFGNWYVPTIEGLHAMCRAAGFREVKTVNGPNEPPPLPTDPWAKVQRRLNPSKGQPRSAPSHNYRALVHAYV